MINKIIAYACLSIILMLILHYSYSYNTSTISNEYIFKTGSTEDVTKYLNFNKELKKLSEKESIYSLKKVTDLCLKYMETTNNLTLKDDAFAKYRDYYFRVMKKIDLNLYTINCSYNESCGESNGYSLDRNNFKLMKFIKNKGYNLIWDNGKFYISESPGFLLGNFSKHISPMWISFLNYRVKEQREGYTEKGKLIISYNDLKDRISYWEDFLINYPEFPEKDEIEIKIYQYLSIYLFGMEESPVYDKKNDIIYPETIKSYEKFISTNTNSKYLRYVKQYYTEIKNNKFKYSTYIYKKINSQLKKDKMNKIITDTENNYVFDKGYIINFS